MAKRRFSRNGGDDRSSNSGPGKRRRNRQATHRPRNLVFESLENRRMLADAGLRYEFDLNGTPVSALQAGQTYVMKAFIRDNRPNGSGPTNAQGVLQAYFNVNYSSVVNIPSGQGVTAGAAYNWAPGGNTSTSGQIIGTGGELTYRTAYSPPTLEQLLYSVPFNAASAGTLTLTPAVDTLNSGNNVTIIAATPALPM
jgi:hypothetical protein